MICRFLDQKMDEIEVHYSELSRAKTSQLAQEKCNLRELIVEQKCDIKELEQRNKQLEAKLIDTKRQINRLNHKRQRDCNRHEQEKKVIKEMVTDMKIRVSEAMDECIERTRRESAEKIQALEKALEKALGEAKITDNDD